MATSNPAEEHLRVIRSLMEKATIYRAISVPTALVGGCVGIVAAAVFHFQFGKTRDDSEPAIHLFLACWLGALILAGAGNIYFLRSDARRRGEKFVSAGMRAALRALWPSYLVAAMLTLAWRNDPWFLPIPWMVLYGLGLLGTQHFAPRSIVFLGWAFLAAGLLGLAGLQRDFIHGAGSLLSVGNLAMGLTFGGFHLIYAVCAWPRKGIAATLPTRHEPMFDFDKLDKIIHEKSRLGIMTLLAARPSWTFQDLKAELELSDGNLVTHLRMLHENGYVAVTKEILDRPQTSYALTAKGRKLFQEYLGILEQIVKLGRPGGESAES